MKLIIREYLSLLKESKELDRLLPDLLLAMGLEPVSKPQIGVRQHGVDVTAIGNDEDEVKKLFLLTIKQGDIGRKDWDSRDQAVRQSLDEIKDVYLGSYIKPEHKKLPKKIILCTGEDLKQEIQLNWKGYVSNNSVDGKVEYAFWGGDKLSLLIEEHIFNEQVLPIELRANIRKTLALIGDPDYDLSDYYSMLDQILFQADLGAGQSTSSKNKIKKSFRLVHLCLNIIFFWAKNEGNLKPALLASERTLLLLWEFLRRNKLTNDKVLSNLFREVYHTLVNIYSEHFKKIQNHCYIRDGLSGYGNHFIQESINVFEQLGIVSTLGIIFLYEVIASKDEEIAQSAQAIIETTKALIQNHMATRSPCFDSHAIEISITIYLLVNFKENDFIDNWIRGTINHIAFSYQNMGRYFPIQSDSFDDLVALNISETINKEKLMEISTLLPILAQWCIVLGLDETYRYIKKTVSIVFPQCTLQMWYPDDETETYIYTENAAFRSGAAEAPIVLLDSIKEMKKMIQEVQSNTILPESLSSIEKGFNILPILSSRHFRTPFPPFYWQMTIVKDVAKIKQEKKS